MFSSQGPRASPKAEQSFHFRSAHKLILQKKSTYRSQTFGVFAALPTESPLVGSWLITHLALPVAMLEGSNLAVAPLSALVCRKEPGEQPSAAE